MKNSIEKSNSKTIDEILLSRDVRSAKSVRTTFKLTANSLQAIEYLNQYFPTKKGLLSLIADSLTRESKLKDTVIKVAKTTSQDKDVGTIRKSFVVEKKTISIFNKTSKQYNVSRDSIINSTLIALHKIIKDSSKKDKENSKKALEMLNEFSTTISNFESELGNLLGNDHNIIHGFGYVPIILDNLIMAVDNYIVTGEDFDPYSL